MNPITVLVIEDGDEYLENLTRFVPGPSYLQAHCGRDAVDILKEHPVDVVYLDMRFDRIPEADLLGDRDAATREHNGDAVRGLKYLMNNQGLYILAELRREGFGALPVVVAYDFSKEPRRFDNLRRTYPKLEWVSDAVSFEEVVRLFASIAGSKA
jgi:DNA-binding NarL/FixJ family response regulator